MKKVIATVLTFLALNLLGFALAGDKPADIIQKPTAEQILLYADALAKAPSTDKKVATEALQKWIDGKLTNQEAEKYKSVLKLGVDREPIQVKNAELCAACKAACCFWWGCNGACFALCEITACK